MSEMSSFYGGRSGASFVIVKHFDGINIPQPGDGSGTTEYTYVKNYYAVDAETDEFLLSDEAVDGAVEVTDGSTTKYLIEQVNENLLKYSWKKQTNDGSAINGTGFKFPNKLAEGMVQCFAKGAASASEVNYGEYVIIDTMVNMHERTNLDNGKVFRRGMDLTTELAGAEYIGQILGPQGESPELHLDKFDTVSQITGARQSTYTAEADDIIPGSYLDEAGVRTFNDYISYSWVTVKDSYGNVEGCLIGFKAPTLVQDYEAKSMSPYEQRAKDSEGKYYNYDLISEDPEQYIDNKWQHPYYQKWQIKVPHGYHGVNSTNIEIIPSATKPKCDEEEYAGTSLYNDKELTDEALVLTDSIEILRDENFDTSEDILYALADYEGSQYYVKKEDCYKYIIRYRETNFDNLEEGEVTYYEIGDYNCIRKITLSENGVMTVFNTSKEPEVLEATLQWIDNTGDTESIEISEEGTVTVWYNTLDEQGNHKKTVFEKKLDWIEDATLSQDGHFKMLYNNDSIPNRPIDPASGHSMYENTLNWVDLITVSENGIIDFYYNSNHDEPFYSTSGDNRIKVIKSITYDVGEREGEGSQKFIVTYNTLDEEGNNEKEDNSNWAAMNYIVEARLSEPSLAYPGAPYYHLLVIYSDPEYRKKFQDKWVKYPSEKFGEDYDQWIDMGNIRGEKGGYHNIATLDNKGLLYDDSESSVDIPPEYIIYACNVRDGGNEYIFEEGTGVDLTYAGWGCTIKGATEDSSVVYFYDYALKRWIRVGSISSGISSPESIIIKAKPDGDTGAPLALEDTLEEKGFWFAAEEAVAVGI